jgi:hypothetical protein
VSDQRRRTIELLRAKAAELARLARFGRTIDSSPTGRAIGEQIEIEAEVELGRTEMTIDRLERDEELERQD